MEPNPSTRDTRSGRASAKDFFLNLGAIVALFTTSIALINLIFRVINVAFPQVNSYATIGTTSISFPVATLIIFFPVYLFLTWLLEKSFSQESEKRHLGMRKWLVYITLFIAGLAFAADLVTVLYYFLNGNELTIGFILKILAVLIVTGLVFYYYLEDVRNMLTSHKKKSWGILACIIVIAPIIWGFAVLGSPHTQQLYKYDEQKVSDLMMINSDVISYYNSKGILPAKLNDVAAYTYSILPVDQQSGESYQYMVTATSTYELCATFNKASSQSNTVYSYPQSWTHPAGNYCFSQNVRGAPSVYPASIPLP